MLGQHGRLPRQAVCLVHVLRPARLYRYDGGSQWTSIDLLDGKRVDAMCVFNGNLFATCYDGGLIYRYDGEKWTFRRRSGAKHADL